MANACAPDSGSARSARPATRRARAASSTSSCGRAAGTTASPSIRCTTCAPGTAGASETCAVLRNRVDLGRSSASAVSLEAIKELQDGLRIRPDSVCHVPQALPHPAEALPHPAEALPHPAEALPHPAEVLPDGPTGVGETRHDLTPDFLVAQGNLAGERPQVLVGLPRERHLLTHRLRQIVATGDVGVKSLE